MNPLDIAVETFGVAIVMLVVATIHTCRKSKDDEVAVLLQLQRLLRTAADNCSPGRFEL